MYFLLHIIEAGMPTVCSETCVGRIRYLGVLLYDPHRFLDKQSAHSTSMSDEKYTRFSGFSYVDFFVLNLAPFDAHSPTAALVKTMPSSSRL